VSPGIQQEIIFSPRSGRQPFVTEDPPIRTLILGPTGCRPLRGIRFGLIDSSWG